MWRERRSTVRHIVELPIRYRVLSPLNAAETPARSPARPNKMRNISDSGLLFLSPEFFKVGTLLELTFPLKDQMFTMEGRVVRSSRDPDSEFFKTGIHFSNITSLFKVKMAEQLYQIDQYRKTLSEEEGRIVSEEEAAYRWIGEYSSSFAEFYNR